MLSAAHSNWLIPGRSPLEGFTLSQLPPRVVATAAVHGMRPCVLFNKVTPCEDGLPPPGRAVKFK